MYQSKILSMLMVLLAAGAVQAQDAAPAAGGSATMESEIFQQAEAGQSQVTVFVPYRMLETTAKGAATSTKVTGLYRLGAQYEYGINEMFSAGAKLSYTMTKSDGNPETKFQGLEYPELFLKGRMPMDFGRLRYGLNLAFAPMKGKAKVVNGAITEAPAPTERSGAIDLTPYVGFDMDAGPGVAGARLMYQLGIGESTTETDISISTPIVANTTVDVKNQSGNVLTLTGFYEYFLSDMLLGAGLNYAMIGEGTTKTPGLFGGAATETKSKTLSLIGVDLYARIPTGPVELVPALSYWTKSSADDYDKYNDMYLSIAGRFNF